MITRRFLCLSVAFALLTGCAQSKPPTSAKNKVNSLQAMFITAAGKTAVFCIKGDSNSRPRLEASVTQEMKTQGFDAMEGSKLTPQANSYSADDLARLLWKSGFKSIAEVTYTGPVPSGGLPKNLDYDLHSLLDPRKVSYPGTQTALDVALRALIDTLIQAGISHVH